MPRFPSLDTVFAAAADSPARRQICIITSEVLGPSRNGGIGTAMTGLAELLARAGHQLTVLYTDITGGRPRCIQGDFAAWEEHYRKKAIDLRALPVHETSDSNVAIAMATARFLAEQSYDIVYFNDYLGHGYFYLNDPGLAAGRRGLVCVVTHGGVRWAGEHNYWPLHSTAALETNFMERRSVELADIAIGPSHHLLEQYEGWGWALPNVTVVQPYVVPVAKADRRDRPAGPVGELVFFGRLEVRKGLELFCDALDIITRRHPDLTITFMGGFVDLFGESSGSYILRRGQRWKNRIRILSRLDQTQAVAYLSGGNRMAIMPSLADNSPCVIYECLYRHIPFLTSATTGGAELIAPGSLPVCTFEPRVVSLVAALERALAGELPEPVPAIDRATIERAWLGFHSRLPERSAPRAPHALAPSGTTNPGDVVTDTQKVPKPMVKDLRRRLTEVRTSLSRLVVEALPARAPSSAASLGLLVMDPQEVPMPMVTGLLQRLTEVQAGLRRLVVVSDRVDPAERSALHTAIGTFRGRVPVACLFAEQLASPREAFADLPCDYWLVLDASSTPTRHALEAVGHLAGGQAYCAGQVALLRDETLFSRQELFGPADPATDSALVDRLTGASDATLEVKNTVCAGIFAVRSDLFGEGLTRFGLLRPSRARLHAPADLGYLVALLARATGRDMMVTRTIWATHAAWYDHHREKATWGQLFSIARQMGALTAPDLAGFLATILHRDSARLEREASVGLEEPPLAGLERLLTSREPVASDRSLALLAEVSAAVGRFELALELLAQMNFKADEALQLVPEFAGEAVRFGQEPRPVNLMRQIIAGPIAFTGQLKADYFQVEGSNVFLLHPNAPSEPVHSLSLSAVKVRGRERLDVICILAEASLASVAFEIVVHQLTGDGRRVASIVLQPGESEICTVDLRGIEGDCRLTFSTKPVAGKSNWYARAYFREPTLY